MGEGGRVHERDAEHVARHDAAAADVQARLRGGLAHLHEVAGRKARHAELLLDGRVRRHRRGREGRRDLHDAETAKRHDHVVLRGGGRDVAARRQVANVMPSVLLEDTRTLPTPRPAWEVGLFTKSRSPEASSIVAPVPVWIVSVCSAVVDCATAAGTAARRRSR
jgi:hypothetical protein